MKEIVNTELELCAGCNRCVRECPMETANITYQDEAGNIKVRVDHTKCIACGRCFSACKHKARYYTDDTGLFFDDLLNGVPISLITAPSIRTNIPDWKRLFTYLRKIGVKKIYDVSLGADICIWAHIRYIQQTGLTNLITQPCPAIVSYCEIYRQDLLKNLSPIHSPMACIAIYMKEHEGINDRVAALSPCIAKKHEFEAIRSPQYNVTFLRLREYLENHNIALPEEETGFDHYNSGLGSIFSKPGGMKENVEFFLGKKLHILKGEGFSIYEKLDSYAKTPDELLPEIFDALNCIEGCNRGPACSHDRNIFEIDSTMNNIRKAATGNRDMAYFESLYREYDDKFNLSRFIRKYRPADTQFPTITEDDIQKAFELLNKTDHDKQNIDCCACGSETCHGMARKIALKVNVPVNCIVKAIEDAREEHSQRLLAYQESKAKSNFLATMSHEIRTPMNAILGITEMQLQNETLEPDIKDTFGKIHNSGDLLLGIINDILDLSKIEAGRLELIPGKYAVASLINDTVQLNMMRTGSKPIRFELDVDENTPLFLSGDGLRIKQILNNLLSNAFKYTNEGTVKLSVSSEMGKDAEDSNVTLILCVSDTGQGMKEEQIAKLFEEYARFNQEANRTTEGTGLGMSITQNLIRLMNGEIFVESEPGKGTVFTVRLPQEKAGSDVLGRELAENLQQFRVNSSAYMRRVQIMREPMPYGSVLIVDDVETNIYVARGLLAPYGLKIDSVESGFAAIERIKDGNVYDIIFMDHMMPKMDGIETTQIIRNMGYNRSIVALTANAVVGQTEMFLNNGFDDFVSKPIDIRQLNVVLNKLIRDEYPPDVVKAAHRQMDAGQMNAAEKRYAAGVKKPSQTYPDPRFLEVFTRDATKSIAALSAVSEKRRAYNENDMRTYIINIHGIKSALSNIGQSELSAFAFRLEQAGRAWDTDVISSETPVFLDSLRVLVEEITPKEKDNGDKTEDEDRAFLREKLLEIKAACGTYDKKTAKDLLTELKKKTWSKQTRELLGVISELLLHSDFDEAANIVDKFIEMQ